MSSYQNKDDPRDPGQLLLAAQRMAGMGSWTHDLRTGTVDCSEATCILFGLEAGAWHGPSAPFRDRVLPEDRPAFEAAHADASPQSPGTEVEYRIRRPDGAVRWLREWCSASFDADGRPVARAGMLMDITERKLTHQQLAESLALTRIATRLARLGAWTIDLPERTLTWSDENCAIHDAPPGYRPTLQEGVGLFPPEVRGQVVQLVSECERNGTPYEFEVPKYTRQGRRIWVHSIGEAVRDADGRIVRLQGAFQDVTQLKEAERAAREGNERFALLSRASRDALWDWDLAQGRLWCDANFAALCGVPAEEAAPGDWPLHVHPDDRERVLRRLALARESSADTWSESYRLRPGAAGAAQVISRAYLQRDAQGRVLRIVGSVTDVTERLALEEQLRQSQRLESVGQLTGGVAHDFNNLLTVIQGNAELLAEDLAGQPQLQPLAQVVLDAAQRGAEMTQHLLAFARRQPLQPAAVALDERVAGMAGILQRALGEQVEIRLEHAPDLRPALVDPTRLDNALLNLCLNARDAMPRGGCLTIATSNLELREPGGPQGELPPGDYVVLRVSDTGAGIAPEHLPRLFEPFFTTKDKSKGTGLGLAMVYGFARQSGGHVQIESVLGRGTTARLVLPRAPAGTPAPQRRPAAPAEAPRAGGGRSILLVEDEEMVRRYASDQLAALGYRVLAACDAAQALAILEAGATVDLLFTDVVMPGLSGRELADRARRQRPGLPVLYTSGYSEDEIVHEGRLDPGVRLLSKPYRREELAQAVGLALG